MQQLIAVKTNIPNNVRCMLLAIRLQQVSGNCLFVTDAMRIDEVTSAEEIDFILDPANLETTFDEATNHPNCFTTTVLLSVSTDPINRFQHPSGTGYRRRL